MSYFDRATFAALRQAPGEQTWMQIEMPVMKPIDEPARYSKVTPIRRSLRQTTRHDRFNWSVGIISVTRSGM
jgi:hypothetical protein